MGKAVGNAAVLREYVAYLRVEKGLRPLTCEAYVRDLEQFAEFVEGRSGTLVAAQQEDVAGLCRTCGSMGWSRGRLRGS